MMTIWAAAANRLIAEGKLEAFPGYGGFVAMNALSCLGRCLAVAGALRAAYERGYDEGHSAGAAAVVRMLLCGECAESG